MAYRHLVSKYYATLQAFLPDLWQTLTDMGWILHDNQDASSYRVYKSDGELADRISEYVKIDYGTANTIKVDAYYYWNATTHAGVGKSFSQVSITVSASGYWIWMYGSKDLVYIISKVSSTYYLLGFGHLPKRYWDTLATLTSDATSGSSVTITVNSTAGFVAGNYYQIVGASGEGRDRVQVSSIINSTQMVIASLPRNYSANSKIGESPSTFGNANNMVSFYPTCVYNASGTNNANTGASFNDIISDGVIDPDDRGNVYVLTPLVVTEASNFLGYCDSYIYNCPTTGLSAEDTFGVGLKDSGTSSGSNTINTLNDTTKAWTTNEYANKVVVITAGVGAGQIRKIQSNTETQLTLTSDWVTIPDTSSSYAIYDEAYRCLFSSSATGYAFREGVY